LNAAAIISILRECMTLERSYFYASQEYMPE